jgi:hypothetical protein
MYDLAALLITSPNIETWNLRQPGLEMKIRSKQGKETQNIVCNLPNALHRMIYTFGFSVMINPAFLLVKGDAEVNKNSSQA